MKRGQRDRLGKGIALIMNMVANISVTHHPQTQGRGKQFNHIQMN